MGFSPSQITKIYIVHLIAILYLLWRMLAIHYAAETSRIPAYKIESVKLDCDPVINGDLNLARSRIWNHHFDYIQAEIMHSKNICRTVEHYFYFEQTPLSEEEKNFPLAYGLVVYKDIVQVLLELSVFYHPQNTYCFTIDEGASTEFKQFMLELPKCFDNVVAFAGKKSLWGSFGILENVYDCFRYLANLDHEWKYYQYLSGTDLPLRTNLEMVRIFKALNGSINTDVDEFESDRYKNMEGIHPPVPLYKSSMSVAVPRAAANFMMKSEQVKELLAYLSHTWIPDESFWSSIAGSPAVLEVPGSFRARDMIWLRKRFAMKPAEEQTVNNVGTTYIGRYQVWSWQKQCGGKVTSWSCVYGVSDVHELVDRPELVAHKLYLDFEPAAFMCLMKHVRQRSHDSEATFDATSYSEMPTVELHNGRRITELSHPEWLLRSSFYHP